MESTLAPGTAPSQNLTGLNMYTDAASSITRSSVSRLNTIHDLNSSLKFAFPNDRGGGRNRYGMKGRMRERRHSESSVEEDLRMIKHDSSDDDIVEDIYMDGRVMKDIVMDNRSLALENRKGNNPTKNGKAIRHKSADSINTHRRRLAALQKSYNDYRASDPSASSFHSIAPSSSSDVNNVFHRPPSRHKPPPQAVGLFMEKNAKAESPVEEIDQFPPPNSRGSSFGNSFHDPVPLAIETDPNHTGPSFFRPFGGLPTREPTMPGEMHSFPAYSSSPSYHVPIIISTFENRETEGILSSPISMLKLNGDVEKGKGKRKVKEKKGNNADSYTYKYNSEKLGSNVDGGVGGGNGGATVGSKNHFDDKPKDAYESYGYGSSGIFGSDMKGKNSDRYGKSSPRGSKRAPVGKSSQPVSSKSSLPLTNNAVPSAGPGAVASLNVTKEVKKIKGGADKHASYKSNNNSDYFNSSNSLMFGSEMEDTLPQGMNKLFLNVGLPSGKGDNSNSNSLSPPPIIASSDDLKRARERAVTAVKQSITETEKVDRATATAPKARVPDTLAEIKAANKIMGWTHSFDEDDGYSKRPYSSYNGGVDDGEEKNAHVYGGNGTESLSPIDLEFEGGGGGGDAYQLESLLERDIRIDAMSDEDVHKDISDSSADCSPKVFEHGEIFDSSLGKDFLSLFASKTKPKRAIT